MGIEPRREREGSDAWVWSGAHADLVLDFSSYAPGTEILPGMAGSARVTARRPEGSEDAGLEIPATAVCSAEDPEKSYVWVVDEASNKLSRREIEAGLKPLA